MSDVVFDPQVPVDDFLPIQGTDYVEFYVGNAKQGGIVRVLAHVPR